MKVDYQGIVPYLFYDDVESAMDWYATAFGFEDIGRWKNDEGKVRNAEMRVGNTELWLDGSGRRQDTDTRPHWIGVWVDDVDAMYARLQKLNISCEAPLTREFGVRMLNVSDDMGYMWGFMRRIA